MTEQNLQLQNKKSKQPKETLAPRYKIGGRLVRLVTLLLLGQENAMKIQKL